MKGDMVQKLDVVFDKVHHPFGDLVVKSNLFSHSGSAV